MILADHIVPWPIKSLSERASNQSSTDSCHWQQPLDWKHQTLGIALHDDGQILSILLNISYHDFKNSIVPCFSKLHYNPLAIAMATVLEDVVTAINAFFLLFFIPTCIPHENSLMLSGLASYWSKNKVWILFGKLTAGWKLPNVLGSLRSKC